MHCWITSDTYLSTYVPTQKTNFFKFFFKFLLFEQDCWESHFLEVVLISWQVHDISTWARSTLSDTTIIRLSAQSFRVSLSLRRRCFKPVGYDEKEFCVRITTVTTMTLTFKSSFINMLRPLAKMRVYKSHLYCSYYKKTVFHVQVKLRGFL